MKGTNCNISTLKNQILATCVIKWVNPLQVYFHWCVGSIFCTSHFIFAVFTFNKIGGSGHGTWLMADLYQVNHSTQRVFNWCGCDYPGTHTRRASLVGEMLASTQVPTQQLDLDLCFCCDPILFSELLMSFTVCQISDGFHLFPAQTRRNNQQLLMADLWWLSLLATLPVTVTVNSSLLNLKNVRQHTLERRSSQGTAAEIQKVNVIKVLEN